MRPFLVLLLAAALPCSAQARPAASAMTCAAAQSLVQAQGAVVMDLRAGVFDRVVRDGASCPGAVLRPAVAPTRGNPACIVGYVCEPRIPAMGG